jgi:hypothetical protein
MHAGEDAPSPQPPTGEGRAHGPRRDLQDLYNLPRSALLSYQRKHAEPHRPRSRAKAAQRPSYPTLGAFAPHRFW